MEAAADFQDWEVLLGSETGLAIYAPPTDAAAESFEGIEDGDSDRGIRADYFALDSGKRYAAPVVSEEDSLADSDNPSWIEPSSESRYLGDLKEELGLAGIELQRRHFGGYWTSDESEEQYSPTDYRKGELDCGEILGTGTGFEGIRCYSENYEDNCLATKGNGGKDVRKDDTFGETGDFNGVQVKSESSEESASVYAHDTSDQTECFAERSSDNSNSKDVADGNGEKKRMVWWKLPFELLKFYAFKVKPIWSISIAAALMGFVILTKRLYQIKRKSQNIPLKVSIDDKRASQFKVHAARLNEAFSVVRRVPIIKASMPTGMTPWPTMALR